MVAGTFGSLHKAGSTKMTQTTMITAGIDTAKDKLDVAVHGQASTTTFANTPDGWNRLAAQARQGRCPSASASRNDRWLRTRRPPGILQANGFIVVVLQPLQVKAFAKLHLRRAKNDRLDAILIAACTVALDARNAMPPDPQLRRTGRSPDTASSRSRTTSPVSRPGSSTSQTSGGCGLSPPTSRGLETRHARRTEAPDRGVVRCMRTWRMAVRPGAEHSRHRRANHARPGHPHAGTRTGSAARKPRRWPAWRRSFIRAASMSGRPISAVAAPGCAVRSMRLLQQPPSDGTPP